MSEVEPDDLRETERDDGGSSSMPCSHTSWQTH